MKRIIVTLSILLFAAHSAYANLEINEVMYDLKTGSDDGREWVEIYNNSDKAVDASKVTFFEADTNHKLKLVAGDTNIPAQGYAIIVSNFDKFKIDWPNYSGTIFDSTFSLSNSGETLAINNMDSTLDKFTYKSSMGAAGDGKSLQKINGIWLAAAPSPGFENKIDSIQPKLVVTPKITEKEQVVTTKSPENISKISTKQESLFSSNSGGFVASDEDETPENQKFSYFFVTTLIVLIGAGLGAVYLVRYKKTTENEDENFELLDE